MKILNISYLIMLLYITIFTLSGLSGICFGQAMDDPAVKYEKKFEVSVVNPIDLTRKNEPVVIPIKQILEKYPDFNTFFYRVKFKSNSFEPSDIPSQIKMLPGFDKTDDELVFQLDFSPKETITVEVLYNTKGEGVICYPVKTQASDSWYRPGNNLFWENELVAYRSYNGVVDIFGKTYPHLRLQELLPDSYHHERLWGIDPYMIGNKPGLGGILLFNGGQITKCYGDGNNNIVYSAFDGGPVTAGGVVSNSPNVISIYNIFAGRYENYVFSRPFSGKNNVLVAPGMQKFDKSEIIKDEKAGYVLCWGNPVDEYGYVGTALVWNPKDYEGIYEDDNGIFIKLRPSNKFGASYSSLAVWNRASSGEKPGSDAFAGLVKFVARCFQNPVSVTIK